MKIIIPLIALLSILFLTAASERAIKAGNELERLTVEGTKLYDEKKYDQAYKTIKKAIKFSEKEFPKSPLAIAYVLNTLGTMYSNQGDYKNGIKYFKKTLPLAETGLGTEHIEVAAVLHRLSVSYFKLGNYKKAAKYMERSLKIYEINFGENDFKLAEKLRDLGLTYQLLEKYSLSEEALIRARDISYKNRGPIAPSVAKAESQLIKLYWASDQNEKADNILKRQASDLSEALDGKASAERMEKLAEMFRKGKMIDDAKILEQRAKYVRLIQNKNN